MAKRESYCPKPQKIPDNWSPDGVSKGKQTGPVRPTPDAHNERAERKEKR